MDNFLFFFLYAIAFVFMNVLVSYFTGWKKLARLYKTKVKPIGESFWFRCGLGNWWILKFVVSDKGLYISLLPPFNIGSPSLLIPLNDIEVISSESSIIGKYYIRFKNTGIKIVLGEDVFTSLKQIKQKYIK